MHRVQKFHNSHMPPWLHDLSLAMLALAGLCSAVLAVHLLKHPQRMWIMNLVWPLCALFGSLWILWQYFRHGRSDAAGRRSFAVSVANGTLHCGSGCTLGDLLAEALVWVAPVIATWFGWRHLFRERIFAVWVLDYLLAFAVGIAFQYFTLAPMRGLSFLQGIRAAVKADALSLTAWQIGMYGFMAIAYFHWFGTLLHTSLSPDRPEFWFMMQLAMACGFITSYPVNWWLIRKGIKDRM
ncbi:MAG TPA: DUF4396 domain-containing protein [Steroidobacteraceae bacterium]|nr:DUF4396 domain-containing protein [Steroidobacteraceae bacterium]